MNTTSTLGSIDCVVLFADIADSTLLYERIGNRAAFDRINRCLKAMQRVVTHTGGRVVKHTGDGLMATFADPAQAIDATTAMGMDLGELPTGRDVRLDIRVGFHFGPVVESEDDLFGETVNLAARLCELAAPGTALTTAETARLLSQSQYRKLRPLPPRTLKGIHRTHELLELVCDDLTKVTAVFPGLGLAFAPVELLLYFKGEQRVLAEGAPRLSIGRDPSADLKLGGTHASRRHGAIEERGGKFVLIDSSSNGTFVVEEDGRALVLRREELVLSGHGWITFGCPRGEGVEELEYRCVL